MDGLTKLFSLLSTTILLNVIDSRQYANSPIHVFPREEGEITSAQLDAQMLVHSLTEKLSLVEDETGNSISAEKAFVSYLILQGRCILWDLRTGPEKQQDEVCSKLYTAHFLQNDAARQIFQQKEVWKEWGGKPQDCFQPVNRVLGISFAKDPIKRKSCGKPTKQPLKRQRM